MDAVQSQNSLDGVNNENEPRRSFSSRPSVVDEVRRLFAIYRNYTGHEPMAGGAQNLLKMEEDYVNKSDLFELPEASRNCRLDKVPSLVHLRILSLLQPSDLCRLSCVSRRWYILSTNDLLWRGILSYSMDKWHSISDDKNPDCFRRACPDLTNKQIYLRCHPNSTLPPVPMTAYNSIPQFFNYLVPRKTRLVMFGPGLDTRTSCIVRQILTDQYLHELDKRPVERFLVTGMLPGEVAGMGSGICLRLGEQCSFNLITLYSNVKAVRHQMTANERVQQNKLFVVEQRGAESSIELSPAVRELCRKTDAFVFIIDAETTKEQVSEYHAELCTMMCEMWSRPNAALLVLVCTRDDQPEVPVNITPTFVANALRLGRLKRKWMVRCGDVRSLKGVREGFHWLHKNCAQNIFMQ